MHDPDGGFPQVIYRKGKMNRYPRWIAGAGDIVRAFVTANEYGAEVDPIPTINWILSGVRLDGHIATASGFRRVVPWVSRRDRHADEIGVVGWCDKAFRALSIVASHHSYASNSDVVRGSRRQLLPLLEVSYCMIKSRHSRKMKQFWDDRARENAQYYIATWREFSRRDLDGLFNSG